MGDAVSLVGVASHPVERVLADLVTRPTGLTSAEATQRLTEYGHNVLVEHRVTVAGVLLRQLRNPVLILLAAAALVSGGRVIRPTRRSSG